MGCSQDMGYTVLAPVGDNLDALFQGMKEFPTERVILITPHNKMSQAKGLEKKLRPFSIPVTITLLEGNMMENMFSIFGEVCSRYDHNELIVNVATGDRLSTCAALSAAFANGLKAFGVMDGKPMLLPIMKLSYYHELSESKLNILQKLRNEQQLTLVELGKKAGMSLSLLSYHLNGTLKQKGLQHLRLVEMQEAGKNVRVKLSQLGALLMKGYIRSGAK